MNEFVGAKIILYFTLGTLPVYETVFSSLSHTHAEGSKRSGTHKMQDR